MPPHGRFLMSFGTMYLGGFCPAAMSNMWVKWDDFDTMYWAVSAGAQSRSADAVNPIVLSSWACIIMKVEGAAARK